MKSIRKFWNFRRSSAKLAVYSAQTVADVLRITPQTLKTSLQFFKFSHPVNICLCCISIVLYFEGVLYILLKAQSTRTRSEGLCTRSSRAASTMVPPSLSSCASCRKATESIPMAGASSWVPTSSAAVTSRSWSEASAMAA